MSTDLEQPQIITPGMEHKGMLTSFFGLLESSGDTRYFHPHEFTDTVAEDICRHEGKDYYCLMTTADEVIAYGMLRGWDEGYEVPSLGVAVSPRFRNFGVGRTLMHFLHFVAKSRGCNEVMLKLDQDNTKALGLYQALGYQFKEHLGDILIGRLRI